ncbi:MAG: FAD-dependent oxidoreductase [Anaerolineae bacterium]|nr:FAD-dependent oxidoreductase [Anaerolineae bacterium]
MTTYIIVGSGVAGVTAAQHIARAAPSAEVHLFGEEPYPYYRRPLLWEFIAGQIEQEEVYFRPPDWYARQGIHLHLGVEVSSLDIEAHQVVLKDGARMRYERLLLATGARPYVPPCAGIDRKGVFTLRTLDDALAIKAYTGQVTAALIIGGGLLGLETARALRLAGVPEVTVIEFFPHLMPRQLDAEGAAVLQSLLEAQGIHVVTDGVVEAVLGGEQVEGVRLRDGRELKGELVLFSTGIRSETRLAQAAGLQVNQGIVVDQYMRTSAEDVFAAGDAAEFAGTVYGIIPAAIEQARVAAANMVTPESTVYAGTLPITTLKIAGAEVSSLGVCTPSGDGFVTLRATDLAAGRYRKLVLRDGQIVGAILLNDPGRVRPVSRLIEQGVDVSAYVDHLLDDDFDPQSLLQHTLITGGKDA